MAHYVNNKDFFAAMVEYKKAVNAAPEGEPPVIPNYIGDCILNIASKFARKPNFYGYTYRDEMVSDAIENCIRYIDNFDPEKSNNPFAYFTQICYYAFIRRIGKEKDQSYIKHQLIQEMPMDSYDVQSGDDTDYAQDYISYIQTHNEFDASSYERKKRKQKQKKQQKKTAIDELLEQDD